MSNLPDKIELEGETNEGFHYDKSRHDLMAELIEKFNELIEYLQDEREPET